MGLFVSVSCADRDAAGAVQAGFPELDGGAAASVDAGPFGASTTPGNSAGSTASTTPAGVTADAPKLGPIQPDSCGDVDAVGLDRSAVLTLTRGGAAGALRYLYPYDGTVFPRGLAAPVLMWDDGGQPADAVHLYIHSSTHGFRGCFKPEAPGRLTLPQAAWDTLAAHTRGKGDPYQVELTILRGGTAAGPIRETLIIAPGTLKGSIFYNSYSSALGKKAGAPGGVILRIPPGGTAEVFVGQQGCAGCHAASADGRRLVTNEGVYALTPGTGPNPPRLRPAATTFPGVSPDGSVYATLGQFVETDTGSSISSAGFPTLATQLSFSPDGRWITFLGFPGLTAAGLTTAGSGLTLMRYDAATRSAGEPRQFPNAPQSLTWPNMLPDDKGIVVADALTNDLLMIDVQSGTVSLLARAMGFASEADAKAHKTFLPYGMSELRFAFYPTVAPVAAGGYFWVYFDSPRRYGNMDTTRIESGLTVPAGINIAAPGLLGTASKQLWVAAIEIAPDGNYTTDRSAPAFYLPGQELGANNHRAFSALDPCRDVGASCQSGTDCCLGFCGENGCEAPPSRCAKTEEACKTASDCCEAGDFCINGFCSTVVLL